MALWRIPLFPDGRVDRMRSGCARNEETVIQFAVDGRLVLVGEIGERFRRRQ